MKPVSISEAEYVAHRLASAMFSELGFDEPIPPFENRYPNRLESCLNQPFAEFGGHEPYPGVENKSLALFYFCIKNHPFENGNKRFAVAILLVFLFLNDMWLDIDPVKLYEIAKQVAKSTEDPTAVIDFLNDRFKGLFSNLKPEE